MNTTNKGAEALTDEQIDIRIQARLLAADLIKLGWTPPAASAPPPAAPGAECAFTASNGEYRNPFYGGKFEDETEHDAERRRHWARAASEGLAATAQPPSAQTGYFAAFLKDAAEHGITHLPIPADVPATAQPPSPVPLSDEQIERIYDSTPHRITGQFWLLFARAVERAALSTATPRFTLDQLADACIEAEIGDAKAESLRLALTKAG